MSASLERQTVCACLCVRSLILFPCFCSRVVIFGRFPLLALSSHRSSRTWIQNTGCPDTLSHTSRDREEDAYTRTQTTLTSRLFLVAVAFEEPLLSDLASLFACSFFFFLSALSHSVPLTHVLAHRQTDSATGGRARGRKTMRLAVWIVCLRCETVFLCRCVHERVCVCVCARVLFKDTGARSLRCGVWTGGQVCVSLCVCVRSNGKQAGKRTNARRANCDCVCVCVCFALACAMILVRNVFLPSFYCRSYARLSPPSSTKRSEDSRT